MTDALVMVPLNYAPSSRCIRRLSFDGTIYESIGVPAHADFIILHFTLRILASCLGYQGQSQGEGGGAGRG